MEISIIWKEKNKQGFFVVKDETPAFTLGRKQSTLPVVKEKYPLKTGVRLSIASTTMIPSGTSYLSFRHGDGFVSPPFLCCLKITLMLQRCQAKIPYI